MFCEVSNSPQLPAIQALCGLIFDWVRWSTSKELFSFYLIQRNFEISLEFLNRICTREAWGGEGSVVLRWPKWWGVVMRG